MILYEVHTPNTHHIYTCDNESLAQALATVVQGKVIKVARHLCELTDDEQHMVKERAG